jgi:hypothetical protein
MVGVSVGVGIGVLVVVGVAVGGWGVGVDVGGSGEGVAVAGSVVADGDGVITLGDALVSAAGCVSLMTIVILVGGNSVGIWVGVIANVLSLDWAGWASEMSEALSAGAKRRAASQPPKNKAVMDSQIKIEIRARRARSVSSSLTMGKIALCASRLERKATRTAITVAPMLKAARISRMVGKEGIVGLTPRSRFGQADPR